MQSRARLWQSLAACEPSAAAPGLSVMLGGALFCKPGWIRLALGRRHPLQL